MSKFLIQNYFDCVMTDNLNSEYKNLPKNNIAAIEIRFDEN